MLHSSTIGGVKYVWREPATSAEVLEWDIRISACYDQREMFVARASAWAAGFVKRVEDRDIGDHTERHLAALGMVNDEGLGSLVQLCQSIANTAKLPSEFVDELRTLWSRDAEVEEGEPEPWCECPRCSGDNPNAPEEVCKFHGISEMTLRAAGRLLGVDETGAILSRPYWLLQIQAERARIRSRVLGQHDRERKASQETLDMWDMAVPGWRTRH
jgi:hypothetical protein